MARPPLGHRSDKTENPQPRIRRVRLDHPAIRRGVAYLVRTQEQDGSWYGRWGVNYLYGTWSVLAGLHSIGADMGQSCVRKAVAWLLSRQNPDGGWGESCFTYNDPRTAGMGTSTASQTAWAVMGLCAFDDPNRPCLRRGIEYLIRAQNADGSWTEDEITGTGFYSSGLYTPGTAMLQPAGYVRGLASGPRHHGVGVQRRQVRALAH